jgi:hypothetical protein
MKKCDFDGTIITVPSIVPFIWIAHAWLQYAHYAECCYTGCCDIYIIEITFLHAVLHGRNFEEEKTRKDPEKLSLNFLFLFSLSFYTCSPMNNVVKHFSW